MTRELVDRMRTCAAAITSGSGFADMVAIDAARLLTEAANLLDATEPLGELMEPVTSVPVSKVPRARVDASAAVWGGVAPSALHACPACGVTGAATVRLAPAPRRGAILLCLSCANTWEYKP